MYYNFDFKFFILFNNLYVVCPRLPSHTVSCPCHQFKSLESNSQKICPQNRQFSHFVRKFSLFFSNLPFFYFTDANQKPASTILMPSDGFRWTLLIIAVEMLIFAVSSSSPFFYLFSYFFSFIFCGRPIELTELFLSSQMGFGLEIDFVLLCK